MAYLGEVIELGDKKYRVVEIVPPTIDQMMMRYGGPGTIPSSHGGGIYVEEIIDETHTSLTTGASETR